MAARPRRRTAHLPGIIDGSKTFAFAQLEKSSRYDLADVSTTAKKKGDGWVIDGEKFVVLNGGSADMLIVTARTKGGQRDTSGIGVFLVPADAKGVSRKSYPTQDGLHAADITFTSVEVGADAVIGDPDNGLPLIERVVDDARIALCAEAVGAMDESLKSTVEYIKTRKQFGVPIGSFQVLQHRAADMFVCLEQARSMAMFATMAGDFTDAKERANAVAAAKVQIGKSLEIRRRAVDPVARRHRHDDGDQNRSLLQAADHDREHLRRHRVSSAPRQRRRRASEVGAIAPYLSPLAGVGRPAERSRSGERASRLSDAPHPNLLPVRTGRRNALPMSLRCFNP